MDASSILQLLLDVSRLKRTLRTGWVMRGVVDAESVADHTYGVTMLSLILAEMVELPLNKEKVVAIALLHDLPEGVLGDLPAPAMEYYPPQAKQRAEQEVLAELLSRLPHRAEAWYTWWQEFEEGASPEARLVRDADRLDMLLQAYVYEQTTGNHWLEEFWPRPDQMPFEFGVSQSLYEELRTLRKRHG